MTCLLVAGHSDFDGSTVKAADDIDRYSDIKELERLDLDVEDDETAEDEALMDVSGADESLTEEISDRGGSRTLFGVNESPSRARSLLRRSGQRRHPARLFNLRF